MTPNMTDSTLYQGDPHPTYRWLRANAPLYWDAASNLWVLSKYEDVFAVSKNPEVFSAAQGVLPESDAMISMICMDDPRHQRLRKLVNRGFTPRMVSLLQDKIRVLAKRIADDVSSRREIDLVRDLAVPMPLYYFFCGIGIIGARRFFQSAREGTQPHGRAKLKLFPTYFVGLFFEIKPFL